MKKSITRWVALVLLAVVVDIAGATNFLNIALLPKPALILSVAVMLPVNALPLVALLGRRGSFYKSGPVIAALSIFTLLCGVILAFTIVPVKMVRAINRKEWRHYVVLARPLLAFSGQLYLEARANHGRYPNTLSAALAFKLSKEERHEWALRASLSEIRRAIGILRLKYLGRGINTHMFAHPPFTRYGVSNTPVSLHPGMAIMVGPALRDLIVGKAHYVLLANGRLDVIAEGRWSDFINRQNKLRRRFNLPAVAVTGG